MRLIFVLALLMPLAASGQEEETPKPWSGTAALGILATSGNSDTTNANLALGVNYDRERWHHEAQFAAAGADTDGVSTAERYKAGYKARWDITERDFLFGLVDWEKDKFSGYDQQISEAFGYGRRVINNEKHVLNVEIGAGLKQSDLRDGTSEDGAILHLGSDFAWTISPTATFNQNLVIEKDSENTFIESVSALKANLIQQIALVFSYTVKNNSDVPAGSDKTDTFTAISLEYGF